uniref:EpnJ n=1 Tax=Streptomyces hygroscopicus TaxID=1912 RepID=V5RQ41_STRHY|nr:EpnJ [Streptomyces hygroscopicus]
MPDSGSANHSLVENTEGDLSVWPVTRPVPPGWRPTGHQGSHASCLAEADRRGRERLPGALAPPEGNEGTLLELFSRTVKRHPARPAVSDRELTYTYTALNRRSDGLAQALLARGVRPGDHIAYLLPRGVAPFVVLLAVLKTGAAYVPLDPAAPDDRLRLLIDRSGASVVITHPEMTGRLDDLATARVMEYVADDHADPKPGPAAAATPRQAASVLFTSGSTGIPKAVLLEHRNLVQFAENPTLPALTPQDRVGHVSNLAFDAFHWETWCAFAAGAEVVTLPTMPDLISGDMRRELKQRRITAMLVPTLAFNHLAHEQPETFSSLRILATGGDVVSPGSCRDLLAAGFTGQLVNLYGPTEAATACSAHPVTDAEHDGSVPIGRALEGIGLYVLDDNLDEVTPGSVGQLHIGGPGVARGYHGQPGLTAERFLPDPHGTPGGRLYATGDLAVRGEDGLLRYVGRADDQVKIRGYRVEPREVERQLARHHHVRDVAVVVGGEGVDRYLAALVVLYGDSSFADLREAAASSMPEYMVPSAFISIPEMPSNDRGKRDLGRLREIVTEHQKHRADRVAPSDPVEIRLADFWKDLISVDEVGLNDDFFALGGNSLQAFRLRRRIVKELGVEVSNREILVTSELSALADLVRSKTGLVLSEKEDDLV